MTGVANTLPPPRGAGGACFFFFLCVSELKSAFSTKPANRILAQAFPLALYFQCVCFLFPPLPLPLTYQLWWQLPGALLIHTLPPTAGLFFFGCSCLCDFTSFDWFFFFSSSFPNNNKKKRKTHSFLSLFIVFFLFPLPRKGLGLLTLLEYFRACFSFRFSFFLFLLKSWGRKQ